MQTVVTNQGQLSVPAELLREMRLTPGRTVFWEKVSPTECRLVVEPPSTRKADPIAAIGFAKRHGLPSHTTAEWMKILREEEE